MKKPINAYHATLRRVPDDIILAVGSREIEAESSQQCLCGWVLRETIAKCAGIDAVDVEYQNGVCGLLARRIGGSWLEWFQIFQGITDARVYDIELAFVARVREAAGGA